MSSPFLIRSYERLDSLCLYLALDLASALLEDVAVIPPFLGRGSHVRPPHVVHGSMTCYIDE